MLAQSATCSHLLVRLSPSAAQSVHIETLSSGEVRNKIVRGPRESISGDISIVIYIYMHKIIYIHIYVYRCMERGRSVDTHTQKQKNVYTYVCVHVERVLLPSLVHSP